VIVIDTSAVFSILAQEAAKSQLVAKIEAADRRAMSLATRVECVLVASRLFPNPVKAVDAFLIAADIESLPVDAAQYEWAAHAFMQYGKGRHAARLSFGDCFSYAAAKAMNAPLLYVGEDFAKTDIRAA